MGWCIKCNQIREFTKRVTAYELVWSDIRFVKAKFQEQIPRKPDLNNIKLSLVTYLMLIFKIHVTYDIL